MTSSDELLSIADKLDTAAKPRENPAISSVLDALTDATNAVGRSFSGSWLGYQSRVYYAGLEAPPPGAHFSQEWGFDDLLGKRYSRGDWQEFDGEAVKAFIYEQAGNVDLAEIRQITKKSEISFRLGKSEIASILSSELKNAADAYLEGLQSELARLKTATASDVVSAISPKGQIVSRDMVAIGGGFQTPPHIQIQADLTALRNAFGICAGAAEIARKAASHIARQSRATKRGEAVGVKVFIGHGRSSTWRELKDFVQDRLRLPWDEFNRVPVAGVTNIARLSQMLESAAVALIIMTAEDELADGEMQARMNVVHEVGLFQGRLGFTKAIVLFEDGCKEFTNIQGLGQIRFPTGRISAAFEDVRAVLEREGLLED